MTDLQDQIEAAVVEEIAILQSSARSNANQAIIPTTYTKLVDLGLDSLDIVDLIVGVENTIQKTVKDFSISNDIEERYRGVHSADPNGERYNETLGDVAKRIHDDYISKKEQTSLYKKSPITKSILP